MTGLHLGLGLNVVADEYKSDVDILGIAKYASGGDTWTFTGPDWYGDIINETLTLYDILYDQIGGFPTYKLKTLGYDISITIDDRDGNHSMSVQNEMTTEYMTVEDVDWSAYKVILSNVKKSYIEINSGKRIASFYNVNIPAFAGDLTQTLVEDITSKSEGSSTNLIYGDKHATNITKTGGDAYLNTSKQLKARTNRIGGELKMSYFHNLTDHVVLGVDVCGTLNQKSKKNIEIDKLNYIASNSAGSMENKKYTIYCKNDATIDAATYDGTSFIGENGESIGDTVYGFFKTVTENGTTYIPERQYTIESVGGSSVDTSQVIANNPGYTALDAQPSDLSQYFQVSNEKGGDVTFEKNKFNSRAAVVLGAQYKGWFAGVRGGVSYNQGKLHVKDSTGTSSEEVSFASPFVGVHLMKSVNMKGLENGHIYVTADVNVQNKQNLKMKGIKNFRQNSVNISLGMTWQIN